MNVNSIFPSAYVSAADLNGQDVPVTVRNCVIEDVTNESKTEPLPVLYFEGMQKGMVLNKTNAATISGMYGDETDLWAGRSITLYPTETSWQGKMVPCVRVRDQRGQIAQPQPVQPAPVAPPQPAPATGPVSF